MNIWREYSIRYPNDYFDYDGIVDEKRYAEQKIKLLLVLKETNDLENSLINFLKQGGPGGGLKTWQPACKWIEAILDGTSDGTFATPEERKLMLRRIATMNLKKVSGEAKSDLGYIEWASGNEDLLLEQINQINPNVIVLCCDKAGNDFISSSVLGGINWLTYKQTELKYSKWNDKFVLHARHPLFAPVAWRDYFIKFHNDFLR